MSRLEFTKEQRAKYGDGFQQSRTKPSYERTFIYGKDCFISKYATIGGQGFGYERDEYGVPLHIPHIGKVLIGDRVDIFEHANVARGTVNDTIIGDDTKIDVFVQVGHNVHIGKRCIICAGSILGGSCEIGDDVFIGLGVIIIPKIKIGAGSFIGAGAVIIRDVPDGAKVVGNPGRQI